MYLKYLYVNKFDAFAKFHIQEFIKTRFCFELLKQDFEYGADFKLAKL